MKANEPNMTPRCPGVVEAGEPYLTYHDQEWGKPEHDEQTIYEDVSVTRNALSDAVSEEQCYSRATPSINDAPLTWAPIEGVPSRKAVPQK